MSATQTRDIYSVSQLNQAVRRLLESHWGTVWLVGEVSNFATPASGHWYFTLKDDRAQIRCAMFRRDNQRVQVNVEHGMQVLIRARMSLYEPRGDYQLIAEHLEPAGQGLLQQQFEALKRQLQQAGLFDQARKQPLPDRIRTLGVITSPSGAAVRDVLAVLKRRDPTLAVIIYPTQVQGESAAAHIRQALATAIRRQEVDAVLLTRGGGSLEDLWCFNDEQLARDIAACPLPTISAVGHETDVTIADFVADVRAATPSQAAELVSQDQQHAVQQLQAFKQRAWHGWQQYLRLQQQSWRHLHQRLQPLNPRVQIQQQQQQVDDYLTRFGRAQKQRLTREQVRLRELHHRLMQASPVSAIRQATEYQHGLTRRLQRAMQQHLTQRQRQFAAQQQALQLVSPLHTLQRGYSITFTEQGEVLRQPTQVAAGAVLRTRIADGEIISVVKDTRNNDGQPPARG